ncbi:MAG: type 4a pilus biogenesis protein PilO [Patescibacteria group bacterium]
MPRLTIGSLLLVLAVMIFVFGLQPQWKKISSLRSEIAQLQALSEEMTELIQLRDDLVQEYSAVPEENLDKILAMTPKDPGTADMLVDVETLAAKHGLLLSPVDFNIAERAPASPLGEAAMRPYAVASLTMGLRGSYEAFQAFLAALERNLRLVDVNKITFASGVIGPLGFSLEGTMYYQR